tara:strand:+ start:124 stop:1839 length:1716 start_codon:yes stop_codon:yes gene_type:complete
MAKFGGKALAVMNFARGVSKVTKKSKFVENSAVNKIVSTRTPSNNLGGVKGSGGLKSVLPKIKPIRPDLKDGGIRKINKLVESRVQNLIPKLSNKIEEKVDSFDPKKFLGKIFDGGLTSLSGFATGLVGMQKNMKETVDFLEKAEKIAVDFVEKLSKAKKGKKKKGGGLIGNVFKGLAVAGAAMIALPAVAKVATAGLMANSAGAGLKKSQDIQAEAKKKKLEKKQDEDKVSKTEGKTDDIFSGIISKLDGVLNFNKSKNVEAEPLDSPIPLASKGKLLGKKKEKPFKKIPLPKQKTYAAFIEAGGTVEDTGPGNPYGREVFMDTKPKRKGIFDGRQVQQRYNLSKLGNSPEIQFLSTLTTEQFVNYILAERRLYNKNKGKPPKEEEKKRVRGTGAKDRGREGGNFSGDKQKNVRGEYMKGAFQIPDLNLKGLMSGLIGGIGGLGSKIGSGLGSFMGGLFSGGNQKKVESIAQASEDPKKLKTLITKAISKPARIAGGNAGASTDPSTGLGGLGVQGAALLSMGGAKTSGSNKMEREIVVPTNSVPGLLAVDLRNMHVLHSKSTFNIVDAI